MTVCKFWKQGTCRNGDSCRFEHPGGSSQGNRNQNQRAPPQNNNNNNNRFGALGGHAVTPSNTSYNQNHSNNNQRSQSNAGFASHQRNQTGRGPQPRNRRDPRNLPFQLSYDQFDEDLRRDRPQWIMSCYGPGRDAPIQLFGGFPLEQSPEEIRVQHYLALIAGNPLQSAQTEAELANQANQQVQAVLGDIDGAIDYIIDGGKTHPNRQDMVTRPPNPGRGLGVFSRDRPNKPRYDSPAAPSSFQSAQPSNFGNQPQQAFGSQPAGGMNSQQTPFGQPSVNAFSGQAGFSSQPTQSTGVFGQPAQSPFGQQQPSTFNQPQNPGAFQQPVQQAPSPFGQPQTGVFGRPQEPQGNQAFPRSFQQPSQQSSQPFGLPQQQTQVPTNGPQQQTQVPTNGFPQQNQMPNTAFGAPLQQQQAQNGFSSFNNPATSQSSSANAFGAPSPNQGFGQPNANVQQNVQLPTANGINPASTNNQSQTSASTGTFAHPGLATYSTRNNNGQLTTWKGVQVNYMQNAPHYRRPDGTEERIWFPDGPPVPQQWELPAQDYSQETMQAYNFVNQNGGFQNGVMPEMAPRMEMVRFDV